MEKYNSGFEYKAASIEELEFIWDKDIADNAGNSRWIEWKTEYIENNMAGKCRTFVILHDNHPIGQGTLLFSPECSAIDGRTELADGLNATNINALRIDKNYEGQGHISKLRKVMEQYAVNAGYTTITIGVEARETRNLAIYLHWGYNVFVNSELEDGVLVLYYSKQLTRGSQS